MFRVISAAAMTMLLASVTLGQTLSLDKGLVTRDDTLKGTLRFNKPFNGDGKLTLTWTDSWGRTVLKQTQDVKVAGDSVAVELPLSRSVAMQNFLEAELVAGGNTITAPKQQFIVTPSPVWDDYQILMYFAYKTPAQQEALRTLGINGGQVGNGAGHSPNGGKVWWEHDYRYYCDQIATPFYAAYHTPAGGRNKNQALIDAKALYQQDRSSKEAFFRKPSFSDPAAQASASARITDTVTKQMPFKPWMYAETDEGGVADLVSAWDFDFSPPALEEMRKWLLVQYGSLEAINKEWGTKFAKIEDVEPLTTDEMMAKGDDNLSAWADHLLFMNHSFSEALIAGAKAGHDVDKDARMGVMGAQMPSAFGGYDYWLLANSLDAIEPYNIGDCRECWRSFAPNKPAMTTAFGVGNFEVWRLWYQALHRDLGIIIYDEQFRYVDGDGKPTKMGEEISPTYHALTGGIAKQLHYMTPAENQVLIHYSQPSITAYWMFEARPEGKNWIARGSAAERRKCDFLRTRESWTKLVEDAQHPYAFEAYAQLENGDFDKSTAKVLILPESIAMSEKECKAVRDFVARGGTVIADCRTALMDAHCKMLDKGQLDDLFGIERSDTKYAPGPAGLQPVGAGSAIEKVTTAEPGVKVAAGATALYRDANNVPAVIVKKQGKGTTIYLNANVTDYHRWRLKRPEGESIEALIVSLLNDAGVKEDFALTTDDGKPAGAVNVYPFSCGNLKLLAIHRNYQLRISELGPTEYQHQTELEQPLKLALKLDKPYAVYDINKGMLAKTDKVVFDLDAWKPTILAMLPDAVAGLSIDGAADVSGGDIASLTFKLNGPSLGKMHAFHVMVKDPGGNEVPCLTQNLAAADGTVTCKLPFAMSDPKGQYTVVVHDVATGTTGERALMVK